MITTEKLEGYLVRLGLSFQAAAPGTWVIHEPQKGLENLLVMLSEPLVILRIQVMKVPSAGRERLFEELLRLNATDMVHGAYAVDGGNVLILDTLEADTMDIEELEASIDAIGLALAAHYKLLSPYRAAK
jgi:hypothetical protein